MPIVVLGINHKTAPVQIRERLAFQPELVPEMLRRLRSEFAVSECVILCTCNRVEIYVAGEDPAGILRERLLEFIEWTRSLPRDSFEEFTYTYSEPESLRHLIRVAAGMDSMVLGETEIFGQMKEAYRVALENGATGRYLNRSFQHAFAAAKKIRAQTRIQRGSITVSSVAVDLATQIFERLNRCRVMIVGAGDTGEKAARAMISRGARELLVVNRSPERARKLADELGAVAVPFDRWMEELAGVDIVLFSTASHEPLLRAPAVQQLLPKRRNRPLLIIDIAVPRNVEEEVGRIDGVFLYNIDDLQSVADAARREREKELARCEELVNEAVEEFLEDARQRGWFQQQPRPSTADGVA